MDTINILKLVKARLGISSPVRDEYLESIIDSVICELENTNGIELDEESMEHIVFIVDYSVWRYQSVDSSGGGSNAGDMPMHIRFRLHNLIVGGKDGDE